MLPIPSSPITYVEQRQDIINGLTKPVCKIEKLLMKFVETVKELDKKASEYRKQYDESDNYSMEERRNKEKRVAREKFSALFRETGFGRFSSVEDYRKLSLYERVVDEVELFSKRDESKFPPIKYSDTSYSSNTSKESSGTTSSNNSGIISAMQEAKENRRILREQEAAARKLAEEIIDQMKK